MSPPELAQGRLEEQLRDKKPLYTGAEAHAEAERCLYCVDAPCIKKCPTEIDIPTFIKKITTSNLRGAARTIFEQNLLGYSCARVCPVEVLCQGDCVYTGWNRAPIQIGRLQRYATEHATRSAEALFPKKPKTGKKVACIGGGPASLACAGYAALDGHEAVVFEKRALAGGLNTTGIAPYKLHVEDALVEVDFVRSLGVEFRMGVEVGRDVSGAALLESFDAVFLGMGLGADTMLGVPGEDAKGVFGATAWIEQMKVARGTNTRLGRVLVVGGGNTAIDVARECAALGADEVVLVYRRSADAMSGYAHELEAARKEGVRLLTHTVVTAFLTGTGGYLRGARMAQAEGGRAIQGTEMEVPCDKVFVAIGQSKLRSVVEEFPGVELDKNGRVIADPVTFVTGHPRVYSGGDCVNGGKEVVNAVADGRDAARAMHAEWSA